MASAPRRSLRIGFVYNSKIEYMARGYTEEESAEFDADATIDGIAESIAANGHTVVRVGDAQQLAQALVRGDKFDLIFTIAEGLRGIARESEVPCICEAFGVPYTHSDAMCCALCMHKGVTKNVVRGEGCIPTANYAVASCYDDLISMGYVPQPEGKKVEMMPEGRRAVLPHFPMFVKPVAEGSSKGIECASKVQHVEDLVRICQHIWDQFHQPAIIEDFLPGREFTAGIVGTGAEARIVGINELVCRRDPVYSRALKVTEDWKAVMDIDALAKTDPIYDKVAETALRCYRILGIRDVARIDIRCDAQGVPNFVEANPLPGMRPHFSDLCLICDYAGMAHAELIGAVIDSAAKRIGVEPPLRAPATPEAVERVRREHHD